MQSDGTLGGVAGFAAGAVTLVGPGAIAGAFVGSAIGVGIVGSIGYDYRSGGGGSTTCDSSPKAAPMPIPSSTPSSIPLVPPIPVAQPTPRLNVRHVRLRRRRRLLFIGFLRISRIILAKIIGTILCITKILLLAIVSCKENLVDVVEPDPRVRLVNS